MKPPIPRQNFTGLKVAGHQYNRKAQFFQWTGADVRYLMIYPILHPLTSSYLTMAPALHRME
jgi:hypothetical protein